MSPQLDLAITQDPGNRGSRLAAAIFRLLWIAPAVALICLALLLSIRQVKLSESGTLLVATFVYSVLISLPSASLLTFVSHRFSERYPRLMLLVDALILLGTATCGTFVGALVLQMIGVVARGDYWPEFRASYPISIVISLVVGLGITSFETMRYKLQQATLDSRTRQMEQERAYKLLAEARLSSLESRIHPHFLFNTLNSIAALIPSDPQRAEDTVGKLASLLRFSLNAHHSGLVPLSQEMKIVRDYLEIERTRFGDRLRYEIDVPASLEQVKVPPLALQSLAENVVKHVVSQRPQGASIQITGSEEANRICLAVRDDGPGFALDVITPEHGLGNLIARMELLYGSAGQLEVARENDRTVVCLSFPA
jgi:sensor histidine kinase YesM